MLSENIQTIISNNNKSIYEDTPSFNNDISFNYSGTYVSSMPDEVLLTYNYQLGSKEFNKLKRLDPQKYIIDAGDIDWGGFSICSYLYDSNNIQTPNNIDINTTYGMLKTLVDLISNLQVRVSNLEKYTVWNPE